VAWPIPNERRWPELPRAWVRHAQWFKMWRRSQRALQAEARKLHASKSSCAGSEASWEALSECSDSSWQAVSELSDSSWLELVTESGVPVQFDKGVNPEVLPDYCCALGAFDSLSEEELANLKLELKTVKEDCQKDLAAAMPALDSAVESLNRLSKGSIGEVRAMKAPPHGVVLVGQALCIMFEVKPVKVRASRCHGKMQATRKPKLDYWEPAKKELLANPNLLDRMLAYDKDNIPDSVMIKIKPLISNPEFQPDQVKKASAAAQGICQWIHAMVIYHHVAKEVQPKRLRLVAAEGAVAKAEGELAMKRAELGKAFEENVHEQTDEQVGADVVLAGALTVEDVAHMAAPPMLEAAVVALDSLEKRDITEIKSMRAPPQPVMIVCMCVVILRPLDKVGNFESTGWAGVKKMLSDPHFLRSLQEYNKDGVNEGQIKKIRNLLAKEQQVFAGDYMKSVSKAGYGLLQWVLAMVKYFEVVHATFTVKAAEATKKEEPEMAFATEKGRQLERDQKNHCLSSCLTKAHIAELKSLSKPPDMVMYTMQAFLILWGREPSWIEAKALLCDSQLFSKCVSFDEARVHPAMIEKLEPYVNNPNFTPECVRKVSSAAGGVCEWVRDTYERARANMDDASTASPTSPQSLDSPRDLEFLDLTWTSSSASDKHPSQVQCA